MFLGNFLKISKRISQVWYKYIELRPVKVINTNGLILKLN